MSTHDLDWNLSSEDLTTQQPSLLKRSFFPLPGLEGDIIILLCTILLLDQYSLPSYTNPATWRLCLCRQTVIFFLWPLFRDFLLATSLSLNFDLSVFQSLRHSFHCSWECGFLVPFSLKWSFPLHPHQNLKCIYVFDHSFPLFWYFLLHDIPFVDPMVYSSSFNSFLLLISFISSRDFMIHYCDVCLANILELCKIPTFVHVSPYLHLKKYNRDEGEKIRPQKAPRHYSTILH